MSSTDSILVAERFVSINGEGLAAGHLAAFIRLQGCNLSCSYCDTSWACSAHGQAQELTLNALADWVIQTGVEHVTLTGGEPLCQKTAVLLLEKLLTMTSCVIEVETNGSVSLAAANALRDPEEGSRLVFTMDCKTPSSNMSSHMLPENYTYLKAGDSVKFVVGSDEDLEYSLAVIDEYDLSDCCQVLLSPVHGEIDPADIVDFMKTRKLTKARLQLQLHKFIWPPDMRGV